MKKFFIILSVAFAMTMVSCNGGNNENSNSTNTEDNTATMSDDEIGTVDEGVIEEEDVTESTADEETGAYSALLDEFENTIKEINECHRTAVLSDYRALEKVPALQEKVDKLSEQLSNAQLTPKEAERFAHIIECSGGVAK